MAQSKRNPQAGWQCVIDGCEDEAVAVDMCINCYQAEQRWAARTPAERKARRDQLQKWQNRMERLRGPHLRSVK